MIVGENGDGQQSNEFSSPKRLLFDLEGHLYIVDARNDRVQKFELNFDFE
jgi:tricorn protease-like protein